MRLVALLGMIATFVAIIGASAAMLTVDGGVIQTFVLDGPGESEFQTQSLVAFEPVSVPEACGDLKDWSATAVLLPGDGPFRAGPGKNLIFGSAADDVIFAGPEPDCIVGGGGNDTIYGRSGADFLDGGEGFDSCDGGGDPLAIKVCEQPAGPFALTGQGHHSVPTIDLTWTGDANAISYHVYRSGNAGGPYVLIGSSVAPSYSDIGVLESTPYYYVVRSVYGDGSESDLSNEAFVYGPGPETPVAIAPMLGESQSPTPTATETQMPTSTGTATATPTETASPTPTFTPSPTLTPTPAAPQTATPTATPVPVPQACLDAGLSAFDEIVLGTEADDEIAADEGSRLIYANAGNDVIHGSSGADCIVAGEGNDTVYALEGTDVVLGNEGEDYLYGGPDLDRVYGDEYDKHELTEDICDGGSGEDLVFCEALGGPQLLAASISGEGVSLSWQPGTIALAYNVYRVAVDGALTLVGSTALPEYRDAEVAAGSTQNYIVRAVFSDGFESEDSNLASVLVPSPTEAPTQTATSTPTEVSEPTETPTVEATSTSTATPVPTETPTPAPESAESAVGAGS